MKKIPLSCERNCKHSGKYSVIADDELFDVLNKYHLSISSNGYVQRRTLKPDGTIFIISMHRQIMGLTFGDSTCVDHINGDRLDNRRVNLRVCTHTKNIHNSKLSKRNKSHAKGVFAHHQGTKSVQVLPSTKILRHSKRRNIFCRLQSVQFLPDHSRLFCTFLKAHCPNQ